MSDFNLFCWADPHLMAFLKGQILYIKNIMFLHTQFGQCQLLMGATRLVHEESMCTNSSYLKSVKLVQYLQELTEWGTTLQPSLQYTSVVHKK